MKASEEEYRLNSLSRMISSEKYANHAKHHFGLGMKRKNIVQTYLVPTTTFLT